MSPNSVPLDPGPNTLRVGEGNPEAVPCQIFRSSGAARISAQNTLNLEWGA